MATIAPYIPESITVHLGSPDSNAENVTVSFSDYVKNVLSSEVYPTWEPAALRANALAIISFALNRIYTEYYRSRGYSFDITSSTAIDQKFINGRNIYENISELVDELFTDYLRKQGFVEPLAAKFCNGVTVTCSGLSQWGSQYLAQDGANSIDILRTYYGEDVEFVTNAPVQNLQESYPGSPVRRGDIGVNVSFLQVALNRISQNYPAIPKVPVDAIFGEATENAVRAFQSIFSLTVDSIVGRATWYTIVMLYTAVLKLGELQSLGQTFYGYSWEYPEQILPGEQGAKVTHLQYMLSVVSQFNSAVQEPPVSGVFGDTTTQAVTTFQRAYGLPETGTVDRATWDSIYSQFAGIETTVFGNEALFPFTRPPMAVTEADLQEQLIAAAAAFPELDAPKKTGRLDAQTKKKSRGLPASDRKRPDRHTGRAERVRSGGDAVFIAARAVHALRAVSGDNAQVGYAGQGGAHRMNTPANYVGQPIRSLQTMLRTIAHADETLLKIVPDGIYGPNTVQAVREFQRQNALPVTGETDNATWNKLVAVYTVQSPSVLPAAPVTVCWTPNRTLAAGSRNSHLFLIQSMLQALARFYVNAPVLTVTGVHDAPSVAAVKWLQKLAALPQTGEIDQTTWAYLSGLYTLASGNGDGADLHSGS